MDRIVYRYHYHLDSGADSLNEPDRGQISCPAIDLIARGDYQSTVSPLHRSLYLSISVW